MKIINFAEKVQFKFINLILFVKILLDEQKSFRFNKKRK